MNSVRFQSLSLAVWLALSLAASAAEKRQARPVQQKSPQAKGPVATNRVVYVPPLLGAPKVRVDAGSRGADDEWPRLLVLAPDHAALTSRESPVLFWYQSGPTKTRMEFTLISEQEIAPLLEIPLAEAGQGKIRKIDLSRHNVKLAPGIEYRWSVSVVPDPENRSKDIVASGVIKRAPLEQQTAEKLTGVAPGERPATYAQAGLWYDALDALGELTESDPDNPEWRRTRAGLLRQVGLAEAADADESSQ